MLLRFVPVVCVRTGSVQKNENAHIARVACVSTGVLIMIEGALPTNCAGTPCGWLMVGSSSTGMIAFITGLWMRGDASQMSVVVYAAGVDSMTYCQVNQVDTPGNGD